MPEYNVYLEAGASYSVKVNTDDIHGYDGSEGPDTDAILDAAYDQMPGGVCAQCSGWNRPWNLDIADAEASEIVTYEDGETVWGGTDV